MSAQGLPAGWAAARLDEIAQVRLGRQRSPKNHSGDHMRPYLRAANVTWKGVDLSDVKEMNFTDSEVATYRLQDGDILLSEASGSASEVGKSAVWRGETRYDMCFQNTLLRVRTERGMEADFVRYRFLYEALVGAFAAASRGVGIHHLGAAKLSGLSISFPGTSEQRRIASRLGQQLSAFDRVDRDIAALRSRLLRTQGALLDEYVRQYRNQVPLSELVARIGAGKSFECLARPASAAEWGVIKVSAMTYGRFRSEENKALPATRDPEPNYEIKAGDILISRANTEGYVGAPVLVGPVRPGLLLSDKSLRLVPAEGVTAEWLINVLKAPATRTQISRLATGTKESMRNVSQKNLLSVLVPSAPSRADQLTAAASIDEACQQLDAITADLARLQQLVAGLQRTVLRDAFTGRLTTQLPTDDLATDVLNRIQMERDAASQTARAAKKGTVRKTTANSTKKKSK